jgi:hypothetical protein
MIVHERKRSIEPQIRELLTDRHHHERGRLPPPDRRRLDITGARWGLSRSRAILKPAS